MVAHIFQVTRVSQVIRVGIPPCKAALGANVFLEGRVMKECVPAFQAGNEPTEEVSQMFLSLVHAYPPNGFKKGSGCP